MLRKAAPALLALMILNSALLCQSRIEVRIPTAEEEADSVWRTLQDISFFDDHGYRLSLPRHGLIDSLKRKSRAGRLSEADRASLVLLMRSRIYEPEDYQAGYDRILERLPLLNEVLDRIRSLVLDWSFKEYEVYTVNLTLYGPGGSYDPSDGSISILTTSEGGFKRYRDPANTLAHEIVHLGIEQSLIRRFKVPHPLKERIVDRFVLLGLGDLLPEYRVQEIGDARIDSYLENRGDLQRLATIVERFLTDAR